MPDRDEKGKWVKGQSGNPAGRSPRSVEETYLQTLQRVTSAEEWERIAKKAIEQAKKGDHVARKWLSDYLMGVPRQGIELGGPDGGPIEMINANDLTDDQRLALFVALYERARENAAAQSVDG